MYKMAPRKSSWGALFFIFLIMIGQGAGAQQTPILTIDLTRLRFETLYGQAINAQLQKLTDELRSENDALQTSLEQEEREIKERRDSLPLQEFRVLAEEFDIKTTKIRTEQRNKLRALSDRRAEFDTKFIDDIRPVLQDLMAEKQAYVIFDENAAFIAIPSTDITAEAVVKINVVLGPGGD